MLPLASIATHSVLVGHETPISPVEAIPVSNVHVALVPAPGLALQIALPALSTARQNDALGQETLVRSLPGSGGGAVGGAQALRLWAALVAVIWSLAPTATQTVVPGAHETEASACALSPVATEDQVLDELGAVLTSAVVPATAAHSPNDGQETPSRPATPTAYGEVQVRGGAALADAAPASVAATAIATAPPRRRRRRSFPLVCTRFPVSLTASPVTNRVADRSGVCSGRF